MLKFSEYFTEMALSDAQKFGKWDDPKNRHGYDKQSIGILNSDPGWQKIQNTFDKIQMADFNLYFVKQKNAWKSAEVGRVDPERIKDEFGIDLATIPDYDEDAITVFFTNNRAADRTPLTPWTIGHRIGHAMIASLRNDSEQNYNFNNVDKSFKSLMMDCYGVDSAGLYNLGYPERYVLESIGTFRSARLKKLNRPFEFIFECFAQYLFNNGNLKFNDLPPYTKTSNKKAWGNETGGVRKLKVDPEKAEDYLYDFKYALENMFYYWIQFHIGTISIM